MILLYSISTSLFFSSLNSYHSLKKSRRVSSTHGKNELSLLREKERDGFCYRWRRPSDQALECKQTNTNYGIFLILIAILIVLLLLFIPIISIIIIHTTTNITNIIINIVISTSHQYHQYHHQYHITIALTIIALIPTRRSPATRAASSARRSTPMRSW